MSFLLKYSQYIILIPFLIGLVKMKDFSLEKKYLFSAIILGIIGELSMWVAASLWENNMPVFHVYTIIEFYLLVSVFFYGKKGIMSFNQYKILIGIFISVSTVNLIFHQGIWTANSISRTFEGIILIILSILFFNKILQNLDVLEPEKTFMFWFSIAVLIYFAGNLLLFIYTNHLQNISQNSPQDVELFKQVWVINYILNVILYSFYSIAFLCKEQKPFPKSSLSAP